ncbi:TPA: hypothetical protein ACRNJF_002850 [Pseudomonas aeruginosa]
MSAVLVVLDDSFVWQAYCSAGSKSPGGSLRVASLEHGPLELGVWLKLHLVQLSEDLRHAFIQIPAQIMAEASGYNRKMTGLMKQARSRCFRINTKPAADY